MPIHDERPTGTVAPEVVARRSALAAAIAEYEAAFGEITEEEMAEQWRADRQNAVVIRAGKRTHER